MGILRKIVTVGWGLVAAIALDTQMLKEIKNMRYLHPIRACLMLLVSICLMFATAYSGDKELTNQSCGLERDALYREFLASYGNLNSVTLEPGEFTLVCCKGTGAHYDKGKLVLFRYPQGGTFCYSVLATANRQMPEPMGLLHYAKTGWRWFWLSSDGHLYDSDTEILTDGNTLAIFTFGINFSQYVVWQRIDGSVAVDQKLEKALSKLKIMMDSRVARCSTTKSSGLRLRYLQR